MKAATSDEIPVRIIPHKRHKRMYRLQWADGSNSIRYIDPDDKMPDGNVVSSYGFYSLSRANDMLRNYSDYVLAMKEAIAMRGERRALKTTVS